MESELGTIIERMESPVKETAFVLIEKTNKRDKPPQFLCMQRSKDRKWTFPGGTIDENESPLVAATREVWEECGIKTNSDMFLFVGAFDVRYNDTIGKRSVYWTLYDGQKIKAGKPEIIKCTWLTLKEINKLNSKGEFAKKEHTGELLARLSAALQIRSDSHHGSMI